MIFVEEVLPTRVVVGTVQNLEAIQNEIKVAVDDSTFSYVGDWGRTHKLSNSYDWNKCVITDYKMQTFEREMYEAAMLLADGTEFGYAINSWLTQYDEGDYAHIHNHTPASFSGAYCYKTGDDVTSRFFFDNGHEREYFDLNVGDFLIFPSHFQHGVTTNMSKTSRITLAFNFIAFRKELLRT